MERVTFLIEDTGVRLGCLLNPDSVLVRRTAGLRPRLLAGGLATGAGLTDDPLVATGGGRTELTLDLLFDVGIAGSSLQSDDVRDLTRPLWNLAENHEAEGGFGRPPRVRFLWGKSWNVLAVVAAVAERLERFLPSGAPQRSWLRMRLLRINETGARLPATPGEAAARAATAALERLWQSEFQPEEVVVHAPLHAAAGDEATPALGESLYALAKRYYGDESWWPLIAAANHIADPLRYELTAPLVIPTPAALARRLAGEADAAHRPSVAL